MNALNSQNDGHHRMSKSELGDRLHALQNSPSDSSFGAEREYEFQKVLQALEVFQIELEMQNRELRDSQQALLDSHEKYVNLYDFSPVGYVTLSDQGMMKEVNLTMTGILGTERKWLLDRSLAPWIAESDLPAFRAHLKKCNDSWDEKITSIFYLKRKDKTLIPVEISSITSLDQSTKETVIRTSIIDLTERRKVEEERDRFFDLSRDLLCGISTNGFFKRLNPSWEEALGYARDELFARPFVDFVHPDDRERTIREFAKVIAGAPLTPGFQNRYVRKDRSIIWLTWNGVISGSVFYGAARDTTAETLAKKAIENEYAWLTDLIQTLPIPLVLAEVKTGNILSMSENAKLLLDGLPTPKIGATVPGDFYYLDSDGKHLEMKNWPRYRAARGETLSGEQMSWHTPNHTTNLLVWTRIIPAKYDRPDMVIVMLQDINLLKEKEASLQEAVEKLDLQIKLREDFVLGLSHDLSTPLTTAKLSVQMIARTATDPNSLSKFTTRCMQSIERMEQMIKDLLDANRIHAGEKIQMNATRFDLARLTTNTVENLSPTYKGRLRVIAPEKCMGNWGKNQIRRVIENLVNNAAKYGSGNSPITICANKVDEDRVSLTVHNFGNPISEKDQESLFEQFKRTESAEKSSKQGWGVGLTLVRGIVESHLGKISVKSTADEGTTFTIVMPTDGLDLKKEG